MQQPDAAFIASLSRREGQILPMISNGLRNKEIAQQLGIAEGTVKVHVASIMKKAGVDARGALNARVLGRGVNLPAPDLARLARAQRLGLITQAEATALIEALPPVAA